MPMSLTLPDEQVDLFLRERKVLAKKRLHFRRVQESRLPPVQKFDSAITGLHSSITASLHAIYIQADELNGRPEQLSISIILEGCRLCGIDMKLREVHRLKDECFIRAPDRKKGLSKKVRSHHVHYWQNEHSQCALPLYYYDDNGAIITFIENLSDVRDFFAEAFNIPELKRLTMPELELALS